MFNFTIIIPNKNLDKELRRCLDSIPLRNDLEVIVIDDNSDPDKVDFNNYPGINRPNTTVVFSKAGRGAGAARNEGLAKAQGKWLIFVDSDDFLTQEALVALDKYINSDADIIYFLPTSADNDTLQPADRHLKKERETASLTNKPDELDKYLRYGYTEPWGKFIKRSLITDNNITFEESLVANDYRFSVHTGYFAKKIIFDPTAIYCVTVRSGSLCNNQFDNERKIRSRIEVCYGVQEFAKKHNIEIFPFDFFVTHTFFRHKEAMPIVQEFCKTISKNTNIQILKSIIKTTSLRLRGRITKRFVIK